MLRVVVADDQPIVRTGLRFFLDEALGIETIGEAATGTAAVALARSLRPDVVVMDIRMPELDGIAATRILCSGEEQRSPAVLVVTTFDLDEYVVDALRAGASGFLLKDCPPEVLVDAVRTVARGDALVSSRGTRVLLDTFVRRVDAPARGAIDAAVLQRLTERESDVLALLARGLSNAAIGRSLRLGEATVKTHVSNVLAKLHLRSRAQAVVLAYECGLVRPGAVTHEELLRPLD